MKCHNLHNRLHPRWRILGFDWLIIS